MIGFVVGQFGGLRVSLQLTKMLKPPYNLGYYFNSGENFMDTSQLAIVKTFLTKIFQENYDEPGSMDDLMFISLISGSIHKYSELFEEPEEVERELYEHTLSEYIKVWLRIAYEKEEDVNEEAEHQEAISHYESYYKENESPW
jgi:hypothetical protein